MRDKVYLRANVVVEPLFNQWYAWSHLIAPATAAMNIANSHLRIMKSYVAAPQVHANAVKNSAMLGGPFIDYQGQRVGEIKALIEQTMKQQAHMLKFAESVKALDNILRNEATGYSLEPLYARIPDNLKGLVELVYDLNNHPAIRFIEGLLYRTEYYDSSLQSLSLSLMQHDDRAFALSTPRFADDKSLHLRIPFAFQGVDELFRMKHVAQPFGYISQLLGLGPQQEEVFRTFFTEDAPHETPKYTGDDIRVRYYGHACLSIETSDTCILIDPALSDCRSRGFIAERLFGQKELLY